MADVMSMMADERAAESVRQYEERQYEMREAERLAAAIDARAAKARLERIATACLHGYCAAPADSLPDPHADETEFEMLARLAVDQAKALIDELDREVGP